jgi:hypothetical protein
MTDINLQEEKQVADFQIVLLDRDKNGRPTGKKFVYSSNDGSDLADFYQKHENTMKAKMSNKKRRRNRNKNKK